MAVRLDPPGDAQKSGMNTVATPAVWLGFGVLVLVLIFLDIFVFHKNPRQEKVGEALGWTAFWIALALVFGVVVFVAYGRDAALAYYSGWLIEKALSVDNLFVFSVIFTHFQVRPESQHRVLFWGILGAIVLRLAFISLGAALLEQFHFLMYVFGAALLFMGGKLVLGRESAADVDPSKSYVLRVARRFIPSTERSEGTALFLRLDGKWLATPLFFVLLLIEATDVIFALDSLPAIFAITRDPFLVFSSNLFAILGLRALYFALSAIINKFRYLKQGVALVLVFVGLKMLVSGVLHVPVLASLAVIVGLVGGSIVLSLLRPVPAQ